MKKVKYSKRQIELIQDSKYLLQKNDLLLTIERELIHLGKEYQENYSHLLEISPPAKLSKGENLKGLPYRVMDFPRIFSQEDVFAIRTIVWWGKQISVTLHLKGKYLKLFKPQLNSSLASLISKDYLFSVDGDEWEHDVKALNYTSVQELNMKHEHFEFLKIATFKPISAVNDLSSFHKKSVKEILSFIGYDSN